MVVIELRETCRRVAAQARHVRIDADQIALYAASLPAPAPAAAPLLADLADRRLAAWYWLTMDAINFGSGWFPTLRKRPGRTGYRTVSAGLTRRFDAEGPWSAAQLEALDAAEVARYLEQDPDHELMAHFAASLNDLGRRLSDRYRGDPLELIAAARGSATGLVEILAPWACFHDVSRYMPPPGAVDPAPIDVPFNKRSQIAAADLARAGAARFDDLDRLTMFADNLVPHVLRLDGILEFDPALIGRIDREELIPHGSPEEIEIRACALHAVELIVTADSGAVSAGQVDQLLWERGQGRVYKASPRHRSRCTAY